MTIIISSLLGGSILFAVLYFVIINILYKKENEKLFSVGNTFIYEVGARPMVVKGFLLISLLAVFSAHLVFAIFNFNPSTVVLTILSAVIAFAIMALTFLRFNLLKERLFLDVGLLLTVFASSGVEAYYSFQIYEKTDFMKLEPLFAMIISLLLFAATLIIIFHRRLFDLRNIYRAEGERVSFIPLAFFEWLSIVLTIFSLVPLLLVSFIV